MSASEVLLQQVTTKIRKGNDELLELNPTKIPADSATEYRGLHGVVASPSACTKRPRIRLSAFTAPV